MNMIDFRSDTVTRPSAEMLEAMMTAPTGDDVFGDDPTVNALEELAAKMFGKEKALFCTSGTMTNQIAIKVHTQPGEEVVCDRLSHIYNYEGGGIAFNSGCSVRLLEGDRGRFTAQDVIKNINPNDPHYPRTSLVSIENTSNKGGGAIWDSNEIGKIKATCESLGLPLHLDGARLFNALVETNQSPQSLGKQFDTISICLSKGLGCPVGSLLIGNDDFISKSRRVRKVFGGGMRQAGIIAAAGVFALNNNIDRLKDDHKRAKILADLLQMQSWVYNVIDVDTNIIVSELSQPDDQKKLIDRLGLLGIGCVGFGPGRIRFVTHLDISDDDINQCEDLFKKI